MQVESFYLPLPRLTSSLAKVKVCSTTQPVKHTQRSAHRDTAASLTCFLKNHASPSNRELRSPVEEDRRTAKTSTQHRTQLLQTNGQVFAAIDLYCWITLLPGRARGSYHVSICFPCGCSAFHRPHGQSRKRSCLLLWRTWPPGRDDLCHRSRPLGRMVTVTHAGYSVHCRVNDRGPFVRG